MRAPGIDEGTGADAVPPAGRHRADFGMRHPTTILSIGNTSRRRMHAWNLARLFGLMVLGDPGSDGSEAARVMILMTLNQFAHWEAPLYALHVLESCRSRVRSSEQLRLLIEVSEAIATHRDLTTLFRDLAKRLPGHRPVRADRPLPSRSRQERHAGAHARAARTAIGFRRVWKCPSTRRSADSRFTTQQPVIVRHREEARRLPDRRVADPGARRRVVLHAAADDDVCVRLERWDSGHARRTHSTSRSWSSWTWSSSRSPSPSTMSCTTKAIAPSRTS